MSLTESAETTSIQEPLPDYEEPPAYSETIWKSRPMTMICPYCLVSVTTKTKKKFNGTAVKNFIFILLLTTIPMPVVLETIHKCPHCQYTLGKKKPLLWELTEQRRDM